MSYLIYPPVLAAANVVVPQVTTYTGSQAPPPSPILIPTNAITYSGNTPAPPPPPPPPPVLAPSPVVCYPAQMVPAAAMQTVTTTTGYFAPPAGVMTYCGVPPPPPPPPTPGFALPVQQPFVGVAVGMPVPWGGGSVPVRLAP